MPTFYSFINDGNSYNFDDIFIHVDYFTFGNLSSWGVNNYGQLGLNNLDPKNTPTKVYYNLNNWKKVSAGKNFASAITSDGILLVWGLGSNGEMGNGTTSNSSIPLVLPPQSSPSLPANFVDVSCGESHIGAVKSDGSIWMWGRNQFYQLGNGNTNTSLNPIQLPSTNFSNAAGAYIWRKISCGYNYCFAISNIDQLWCWGDNQYGQLGSGSFTNILRPSLVSNLDKWNSISCGKSNTVGIKIDRSLHATGDNTYGQLGTGNLTNTTSFIRVGTDNDWKQVSCGENHTIAIKTNGTMWAWGNNDSGQLGFGVGIASTSTPIQIGSDINWKQVSCGSSGSSAIKTDGSLWSWGLNNSDQLGLGSGESDVIYLPTKIGTDYDWKQVDTKDSNFYAIKYNTSYI